MATLEQKKELIEVLKFTPRTYKITMWGYGGEVVLGTVDKKIYDYFKHRRLSVPDYAWDSDYAEENNIPEEMHPFYPGQWHDCDNMGHAYGVSRNAGTLQIEDENGQSVYEKSFDDFDWEEGCPDWCCNDEVWIDSQDAGTAVFIGRSNEKGTFFEGEIELTAPFDITKLELHYDEIDGEELINSVIYDGVEIDNWGGSTDGKSSDFGFYIAGSQKENGNWEKYATMDDIQYSMTEWFPSKVKPVREGNYNVKTKDGYTYHAKWTGERWISSWHDDEPETETLKIKEWQGIDHDPDEETNWDPVAELEKINVPEEINMTWPFGPNDNEPAPFPGSSESTEKKELTAWTVSTYYKKSIEEVEHFVKDGMEIVHRTGWRSGSWTVYTNDGNPPEFEFDYVPGGDGNKDSIDMNNCYGNNIEEVEMNETWDGCWDDTEWPDDIDEDEQAAIEEAMEEDGYYDAFESNDWSHSDTEMWIWGPILIEGDNNYRKIIVADEDGNVVDFKEE